MILPNKARIFGEVRSKSTSRKIALALSWLSAVISMKRLLVNSTKNNMYSFTTVVLPKPRGKPIANWVSSCK